MNSIQDIYMAYNGGAIDMDNKTLVKLFKDCNILDKKVTSTDIDIIFSKHKSKGLKKLNYGYFI